MTGEPASKVVMDLAEEGIGNGRRKARGESATWRGCPVAGDVLFRRPN
jgi:hypothetical protein